MAGNLTRYDEVPGHPLAGVPQAALDAAVLSLAEVDRIGDIEVHDREDIEPIAHAVLMAGLTVMAGLSSTDDICQRCGHGYEPWFTDNWLWNLVMGGPDASDDPGGLLCPRCFAKAAQEPLPGLVWRFVPEWTTRERRLRREAEEERDAAIERANFLRDQLEARSTDRYDPLS